MDLFTDNPERLARIRQLGEQLKSLRQEGEQFFRACSELNVIPLCDEYLKIYCCPSLKELHRDLQSELDPTTTIDMILLAVIDPSKLPWNVKSKYIGMQHDMAALRLNYQLIVDCLEIVSHAIPQLKVVAILEALNPPQKEAAKSAREQLPVFFEPLAHVTYERAWEKLNNQDISGPEKPYLKDNLPKHELIQLARSKVQDAAVKAQVDGSSWKFS